MNNNTSLEITETHYLKKINNNVTAHCK